MAEGNPVSFLRVNKAEIEFDAGVDPHDPVVYERARDNLRRFLAEGVLTRDERPSFYVYALTRSDRMQTGLVALTSVDEYARGLIKKHEHTRPGKVEDRAQHILTLNAQVGPVFSTFRSSGATRDAFAAATRTAPAVDFVAADGVRHVLWTVASPDEIRAFERAFAGLSCLYIADGHHRSEAALVVRDRLRAPTDTGREPYAWFLNVLFPDDELTILPYNRVVKDLRGLSVEAFLARAADAFEVTPSNEPVVPAAAGTFGFYTPGRWTRLRIREGRVNASDPVASIDAAVLADHLIEPVLGISDPRRDDRIDFVGGIRGTEELVRLVEGGEFAAAFSLHATSIDQLLAVADAGRVMPPKSTWFEPKLRSGMVVNDLSEGAVA